MKNLEYSDGSLWGITPFNARVRLADMRKHSPMNGIDQEANAAYICHAVNTHAEKLAAFARIQSLVDIATANLVNEKALKLTLQEIYTLANEMQEGE